MSYKGEKKSNVYGSEEGYELWAEEYDKSLGYLNSFEENVFLRFLGNLEGKKVLDIGCGTGRLIPELKHRGGEVVAADLSAKMLNLTSKKFPGVKTVVADIDDLPFEDESFDMVIAMFVVVHLGDLRRAFDEVYRVLKNGGVFILSNINQRKAPKLKLPDGREIVIKSFYHMPKHLIAALDNSFFKIDKEEFVYEKDEWINQIVKAVK